MKCTKFQSTKGNNDNKTLNLLFPFKNLPIHVSSAKQYINDKTHAHRLKTHKHTSKPSNFRDLQYLKYHSIHDCEPQICILFIKGETAPLSLGSSFGFPKIAGAGAKARFLRSANERKSEEKTQFFLCEIRKWRTHSILWAHRIKRRAHHFGEDSKLRLTHIFNFQNYPEYLLLESDSYKGQYDISRKNNCSTPSFVSTEMTE